jgi:hypothetical protein
MLPNDQFGVKMRKSHSEHFSAAVPQKADVVLHRGERQLRAKRRLLWLSFNCVVRVGQPVNSPLGPEATPVFLPRRQGVKLRAYPI